MAIYGKHNIAELIRMHKLPYWKIAETEAKKTAGNYVATADYEQSDLGIESSVDLLSQTLNRLTPGRYLLTAYAKPGDKRGGVDTSIEVESGGSLASIGSTSQHQVGLEFHMEGIGKVNAENFEAAITKKIQKEQEAAAERLRIKNLEEENRRLKAEARQYSTGVNKGLYSIGALIWESVKNTPAGKNIIGLVGQAGKQIARVTEPGQEAPAVPAEDKSISGNVEPGDRIANALSSMLEGHQDDPDKQKELAEQLELLARVKKNNPELLDSGMEYLKTMA